MIWIARRDKRRLIFAREKNSAAPELIDLTN
jgi:hypothetical protein